MKNNRKYNNNKGAALISVMIAVTFITIVASALLYMAYMNFAMKSMSVQSKSNFYETEGYLQNVTVKMQDIIAQSSNPETTLATYISDTGDYNCKKILEQSYSSYGVTGDADSASFEIDGDTVTLKKGTLKKAVETVSSKTKKYTFKDLTIIQENQDGLVNNIKTDVVYYVTKETTNAKAGGIGEFSMLMDGSLSSSGGKFDSMTLYGNNFISDAEYRSDLGRTIPGDSAIVLDNCAKITMAGEYCVVYGDIHLYNSSSLIVTKGNLCVYGDIYLHDQSTLICSGNIYMVPEALGDIYGRTDPTSIKCDGSLSEHLYPASLGVQSIPKANFDRVVQILHYDVNDEKDDGLVYQIINPQGAPIYERTGDGAGASFVLVDGNPVPTGDYIKYTDLNNEFYKSANVAGRVMGWGSTGCKTSFNAGDFDNRLAFLIKDGAVIKETCYNSTIISPYPIVYSEAHGIQLSKIGEDMFNYLSVKYWDTTNPMWNSSLFYNIDYSVNGNNYHGYPLSCGDFFVPGCNEIVNEVLTKSANGGGGGTPIIISSLTFENWVKDSED